MLEGCPRGREKGRDPMCKWIGQFTEQQEGRMLVLMQAGWVLSEGRCAWSSVIHPRSWSPLLYPNCRPWSAPRLTRWLLLQHSFAKLISFSPMTSNMLLISNCFYPAPISPQATDLSYCLTPVLRWPTAILSLMVLEAAQPSLYVYNNMHVLKHHLNQKH